MKNKHAFIKPVMVLYDKIKLQWYVSYKQRREYCFDKVIAVSVARLKAIRRGMELVVYDENDKEMYRDKHDKDPLYEVHKVHNYSGYTSGCRCDFCKKAKYEYDKSCKTEEYRKIHNTPHGISGYHYGCRCDICKQANREYNNKRYHLKHDGIPKKYSNVIPEHGTLARYTSKKYGCNCNLCKEAYKLYRREYRKRSKSCTKH